MIYPKPHKYVLFHIGLGFLSYYYPILLWIFIGYQLLQYVLNVRFFLIEGKIEHGNTLMHTTVKLVEFFFGHTIAQLLRGGH